MRNKKILLTGGAGYIGSHIAVELLNSGFDVVIADNLSNSSRDIIDKIEKITGKRPVFYEIDIRDKKALSKLFDEQAIDSVIHLSGLKAVGESIEIPLVYYDNNMNGLITLLKVMKDYNVNNIVYSSSATVYGVPDKVPLTEDMPLFCTNPYGWTKLMGEQILRDFAVSDKNLSVVILRYFNPIGAHSSGLIGERPNGIPNNLMPYICDVASGKQAYLSVFGDDYPTHDGTGVRDYIHIVDLAKGHLQALDYAEKNKGVEIVNLGTGEGYSVLEIIKAFEKANGISIPYKITGRRSGDVAECYSDPSKAKEILGWQAKFGIEEMCRDAWNFARNELN